MTEITAELEKPFHVCRWIEDHGWVVIMSFSYPEEAEHFASIWSKNVHPGFLYSVRFRKDSIPYIIFNVGDPFKSDRAKIIVLGGFYTLLQRRMDYNNIT